jgi:hypothetical protein
MHTRVSHIAQLQNPEYDAGPGAPQCSLLENKGSWGGNLYSDHHRVRKRANVIERERDGQARDEPSFQFG